MPNKNSKFYACDIETLDGLKGKKFAVGCILTEMFNKIYIDEFKDQDKFCRFIMDHSFPDYRFYFHNLSFDIRFILDYCQRNNINIPMPIIRGSSYITQNIFLEGKKIKIMDSYSLIPMALDNFTKVFGLKEEKLKVNFEDTNIEELTERCKSDVKLLYAGLEAFFKIFPSAKRYNTLPQVSMGEFCSVSRNWQFSTKQIKNYIEISPLEQLSRLGYYGGRCEIFDFNRYDKTYCYDINSLYPYVMKENFYPIRMWKELKLPENNDQLYYVNAKINLPYAYIPSMPVKTNHLIFGIGKFEGWFYSPEFNLIKDIAEIEIKDIYYFESSKIFKRFINKYWNLRQKYKKENNPIEKLFKLYMNSLYGKFGQKRMNKGYSYSWNLFEDGKLISDLKEINDGVYIKEEISINRSRKINPFISGFVTSYARANLWNYLQKNNKDSLYCDTDSIFSLKQLPNVGDDLGQFKLEGIGQFKPLCNKTYFFQTDKESKHKAKGISNVAQVDDYDDFLYSVWYNNSEIYAKTRESMRRFGSFLSVKNVIKNLSLKYDKRQIMEDLTTEPLVF